ncbi:MAG: DNA repair protein RecO [Clostridia bacterium]|nr:DNA repair protein RecO [Clostridia bacterium]
MAEILNFPALVIRQTDYGENDKLLTLLTAERGKMTVCIKGGKSLRNKNLACSGLLCYSEFTVKGSKGFYALSEAALIEQFFGLRGNLTRYAAAQYVADVAGEVCVENNDESEMLQLVLNTLYMLSETDRDVDFVKAVFEMRCALLTGLCPDLSSCGLCQRTEGATMYLDVMNGSLRCPDCFGSEGDTASREGASTATVILPLSPAVLGGLRYVVDAPAKRIFSFAVPEDELRDFCRVCEKYLLNQLERSFRTLEFYRNIRSMD